MDIQTDSAWPGGPSDRVFELAADLFSLLSAPTRLRIVCALRAGERNVGQLLECVGKEFH